MIKIHKVSHSKPGIWPLVRLFLPQMRWGQEAKALTWGDTIYIADKITPDQLEHERVHLEQQRYSKWYGTWAVLRYLISGKYRYQCELPAFRRQWQFCKSQIGDRNIQAKIMIEIATAMSNGDYGAWGVTYSQALEDLTD